MSILKKGLLLIAIPLAFQLVFVAFLLRVLSEAADAETWALHTKDVITLTERAFGQLALMQGASRAYTLSKVEAFARDQAAAVAAVRKQFADLDKLVGDNPPQQARVRLTRDAAEKLIAWNQEQSDLVRAGKQAEAEDRVRRLVGRERLDETRKAIDQFLAEEERLDRDRTTRLAEARTAQRWAIGGGTVGMAAVTVVAAYLFGKSIAGRLGVVTANAERLAEDAPLAPPVGGRDEIGRLDEVVHESARRLLVAGQTEAQYQAELERRAAELAKTVESLRQQTQENEMFVYSVSHDLRSPLVNLQGFSKELEHACRDLEGLLRDERVPADVRARGLDVMASDVGDSLRFIKTAVSRSSAIIDALLRLSRAGRVEYRLQTVDVAGILRRVVDAMHGSIRGKAADVLLHDLAPAWGDPTAIEQVFGNLVGNAVNYLDPSRPGRVEVGMADDGRPDDKGLRTYYVKDNGLGIPAAYLAKVFVAFQRLHGTVAEGEGIGLALVRRVIERHGGRVRVESTEGAGATFYVALPAEAETADVLPAVTAVPSGTTPATVAAVVTAGPVG
jgi:signal transduction histidine kinase